MNKRAREILVWILEKKEFGDTCTMIDLMEKHQVSERTIRYDLEDVNAFLIGHKHAPLSFGMHGSILLEEDIYQIRDALKQHNFYSFKLGKDERREMIKYLLLDAVPYITLQQIADILYVSRSTIIHDLDDVKEQLAGLKLNVVSLQKGLCITGKESQKRFLLLTLLRKSCPKQFKEQQDKVDIFSEQDMEMLKKIIKDAEIDNKRFLTDASFEDLKQYITIFMERSQRHENIEIDYINQHSSLSPMAKDLMDKITAYFGIKYMLQEEYVLYDILNNLHYLKRNDADERTMQIQVISKQFIDAITKDLKIDMRNDFQFYQNLTDHLQSTFQDIDMGENEDFELLQEIVKKNQEVVAVIKKNIEPLNKFVQRRITDIEIAYITIHVCAALERNKYQGQQFTILLVCNSGVGTSQLLLSRLKKYFQFYVADVLPVHAVSNYDVSGIDLIISTVPIQEQRCESIILHPFLSDEDCILLGEKLEHLKSYRKSVNSNPSFLRMQTMIANTIQDSPLDKDEIYKNIVKNLQSYYFPIAPSDHATLKELLCLCHIQIDVECRDWREAVEKSAAPLLQEGYISENYVKQMIRNIENMGPYIVLAPGFALPHESPDMGGKRLGMNLIRLKQPVHFQCGEFDPVEFVCCLATMDKDSHLKAMFHLMNLLAKPDFCENIHMAKTAEEIYQIFYEYESIL